MTNRITWGDDPKSAASGRTVSAAVAGQPSAYFELKLGPDRRIYQINFWDGISPSSGFPVWHIPQSAADVLDLEAAKQKCEEWLTSR